MKLSRHFPVPGEIDVVLKLQLTFKLYYATKIPHQRQTGRTGRMDCSTALCCASTVEGKESKGKWQIQWLHTDVAACTMNSLQSITMRRHTVFNDATAVWQDSCCHKCLVVLPAMCQLRTTSIRVHWLSTKPHRSLHCSHEHKTTVNRSTLATGQSIIVVQSRPCRRRSSYVFLVTTLPAESSNSSWK